MIDASKILTFANNLEDKHEGKGYKWLYDKLRYEIIKQNQAELNNNEVLNPVSFLLPTNDEIIEKHNSLKTVHGEVLKHTKDKLHRVGYYRGAIWMRELISNES